MHYYKRGGAKERERVQIQPSAHCASVQWLLDLLRPPPVLSDENTRLKWITTNTTFSHKRNAVGLLKDVI